MRVGDFDLGLANDQRIGFDLQIEAISVHPNYSNRKAYFDVAVLHTKGVKISSEISSFLQPVCLPDESSTNRDEYARNEMQLVGKSDFLFNS